MINDQEIKPLEVTSIGDLILEPDPARHWLIDDLLLSSGLSILAGKPKAGKSTTVKTLANSIAKGTPFFGRACLQSRVLYLAIEEDRTEFKNHFKKLGVDKETPIFVYTKNIGPPSPLEVLESTIDSLEPSLVIIDTIFKWFQITDLNDYQVVNKVIVPMVDLSRRKDCHILGVHHAKKGKQSDGDSVLGSQAIAGAADLIMLQGQSGKHRTFSTINRYGVSFDEKLLKLDSDTNEVSIAGSKFAADIEHSQGKICNFLSNNPNEIYLEKELLDNLQIQKKIFVLALRNGVEQNQINRSGKGKKSDPFLYSFGPTIVVRTKGDGSGNQESLIKGGSQNTFNSTEPQISCPENEGTL